MHEKYLVYTSVAHPYLNHGLWGKKIATRRRIFCIVRAIVKEYATPNHLSGAMNKAVLCNFSCVHMMKINTEYFACCQTFEYADYRCILLGTDGTSGLPHVSWWHKARVTLNCG